MKEFITQSVYFGVVLTFIGYTIGRLIRKKIKFAVANPLLIRRVQRRSKIH